MTLTAFSPSEVADRVVRSAVLKLTVNVEGARTTVRLQGEADLSARPILADVLSGVIAEGTGDVVIDLAELGFIDSTIVDVFATAQHLLAGGGRRLTFRSPSRLADHVLTVFGLADQIENRGGARDPTPHIGIDL